MTMRVKICGITTPEALEAAIGAGADYIGLVFYPRSPRNITLASATLLAERAAGRIRTVALTVDASDGDIDAIVKAARPDYLQLHGAESVERTAAIGSRTEIPIIKAIKVRTGEDIRGSCAFEAAASIILFDGQPGASPNALPGGNGASFDWTLLRINPPRKNFMLSGGLNPDNVRAAISASGALSVDVSSGVEVSPGVKSPELIHRFVENAKRAAQA